jgi:sporulation protein YlmC with PRC-barrel domain
MPLAFAQTMNNSDSAGTAASSSSSPTAAHAPVTRLTPGQIRFSDLNGATVYDSEARNIGDVKDVVLDRDGRVAAVVLDVGSFLGIGGKLVAVSLNDIKTATDNGKLRFSVNMTKEQLKSAQAYDLNPKNTTSTGTSTPPSERNR